MMESMVLCKLGPRGEAMMGMPAANAGALRVELKETKRMEEQKTNFFFLKSLIY